MFIDHAELVPSAPDDWAERNAEWERLAAAIRPARKLRQRNPHRLSSAGHGVSLRIEGGALVVRDGFTHYPQQQATHRLFPGDLALPPRIILLDGSGTLSFDVLSWLAEQGIPLARVKWTGEVATVASGACFDRAKVDWQRATRADETKRLAFAANLIRDKLLATVPTLQTHFQPCRSQDVALGKVEAGIEKLRSAAFRDINDVFAIEGECASAYFAVWKALSVNWSGATRKPIPEQWRSYGGRSSLATGVKAREPQRFAPDQRAAELRICSEARARSDRRRRKRL